MFDGLKLFRRHVTQGTKAVESTGTTLKDNMPVFSPCPAKFAPTLQPATMKFFIDTANLDQIREAQALGILDGVTTNPS